MSKKMSAQCRGLVSVYLASKIYNKAKLVRYFMHTNGISLFVAKSQSWRKFAVTDAYRENDITLVHSR
jgi:hypothetical protein